jgi:hypothetical protein
MRANSAGPITSEAWERRPSHTTTTSTGVPTARLRAMVAPHPMVSSSGWGATTSVLRPDDATVSSTPSS